MAMRTYPDDCERDPIQMTLRQFVNKGIAYYNAIQDGSDEDKLKFLKFVLAGRQGLDLDTQRHVTLNVCQGLDDIAQINTTRDFDSLIGTTKTLPYIVPLTIWPAPSFRDTLMKNNHVTSIAINNEGQVVDVPMHKIPNLPFGKVANRSMIRTFFPRMYSRFDSNKIPSVDIEAIYNNCLRPIIQRLMPNQATHWPATYAIALQTGRDCTGRLHLGSLDIPAHLLPNFARQYLELVQQLRPYFRDAYFGHELRGWKAATVHNIGDDDVDDKEEQSVHERVNALDDLTRILDMRAIRPRQWLVDIGLEFGIPGKVITWRSAGHNTLLQHIFPDNPDIERSIKRSKMFYVDPQAHLKDVVGFRWMPGQNSDKITYIQAYTTEKSVSYQLHDGIFCPRNAVELLTKKNCEKLLEDLDRQSTILHTCAGDEATNFESRQQAGCARLEVRVYLSDANEILINFPRDLINQVMVQIPTKYWWYFKWLRLAVIFVTIDSISKSSPVSCASENSLTLGALCVWIMNGIHRTPDTHILELAKEASPEILLHEDDDPDDEEAPTIPLMDEAGLYFLCDVVADDRTHSLRLPWAKSFSARLIAVAYEQGTLNDVRRLLGAGQVETGRRKFNSERTTNRSAQHTLDVRNFCEPDQALPHISNRLDGLPLPEPRRPHGPDVDYFQRHGGGNRQYYNEEELKPSNREGNNPLKNCVQELLEQMYYDILQESPNKRSRSEGAWTNIPCMLRAQLATEELYMQLEFPFFAVQYIITTEAQWETHFSRFFPSKIPEHAGQNFGKCRYYHSYLTLVGQLSRKHLAWVRGELHQKFNSLAWIPSTESDRMWCTRKINPSRWNYLPANGRMEGPKIAINPTAIRRLRQQPALRLPPRVEELQQEEEEEEEEEEGENQG